MKRLILLRHGKSDWDVGGPDHARPLAPRGVKASKLMGALLARAGQAPDLVLTSSATRARTTAELAGLTDGWDYDLEVLDALYAAGPHDVVHIIRQVPDTVDTLMLVGHQPTWSEVAALLTGGRVTVATATAVGIDFETGSWREVAPNRGSLAFVLPPRLFADLDLA